MRWASPIQSLHLFSGENAFLLVVLGGLQEISYAGFDLAVSLSPAGLVTLGRLPDFAVPSSLSKSHLPGLLCHVSHSTSRGYHGCASVSSSVRWG